MRPDFLDLPQCFHARGVVTLPGSKSISNRSLLLAALSQGQTRVQGLLDADDTRVMLTALETLGVRIERVTDRDVVVHGCGGVFPVQQADLFLGNAGTALRPLTASLVVSAAHHQQGCYQIRGVPRMHERPIGDLVDGLRQLGADIRYLANAGYPPLEIVPSRFNAGSVSVRGDTSSQFLTALLMMAPLVAQTEPLVIHIVGELISKPYVDMTLNLMRRFGVTVTRENWQHFTVAPGQHYRSPGYFRVEGDASSASYFLAAGAIAGGPVRVEGVGAQSIQGDVHFAEALVQMGARITTGDHWIEVSSSTPLQAIDIDCNDIPDAAMTLAVCALYAQGTTRLRNIASWRVKETDRIAAMATELRKLGAEVEEGDDFIRITPPQTFQSASIATYDDHRVAMCFSLAAFGTPVRILDPHCVAKTFPEYFDRWSELTAPSVPTLTIDGPTASGKGTVAARLAAALGFHLLDSGALYRLTALSALQSGVALDDESALARLASQLDARFTDEPRITMNGQDVTEAIRREDVGNAASKVAAFPDVRAALTERQRAFRQTPGLVADGRDMGTVIFPDAQLKVYLTASVDARARRRYNQLIEKGFSANLDVLSADLSERDARDANRREAPLKPAEDAYQLDSSALSIEEVVAQILSWWQEVGQSTHRRMSR